MPRRVGGFIAAVATLTSAAACQRLTAAPDWTEQQYLTALDSAFLLRKAIDHDVYGDSGVRSALNRVGLSRGCPIVETAIDRSIGNDKDAFVQWAIPTLRSMLPAGFTKQPAGSIAPAGPYANFGRILLNRLKLEKPDFAPTMRDRAVSLAGDGLKALPAASGDWRGLFQDWDFARLDGAAYAIACRGVVRPNVAAHKKLFYMFYRIGGTK